MHDSWTTTAAPVSQRLSDDGTRVDHLLGSESDVSDTSGEDLTVAGRRTLRGAVGFEISEQGPTRRASSRVPRRKKTDLKLNIFEISLSLLQNVIPHGIICSEQSQIFDRGVVIACLLPQKLWRARFLLYHINAVFCIQIFILQHFSRSTRLTHFCTAPISKFQLQTVKRFARMNK